MKIFSPEIIHTFCLSEKAIREIANPFYTDKRDGWSDTPRGTRHRCYEKRHPLRLACAPPKSLFSVKIKNKPASSDSPRPTLKGKYRSVFLDIRESENKMKPTGRQSSLSKKKKQKEWACQPPVQMACFICAGAPVENKHKTRPYRLKWAPRVVQW